MLGTSSGNKKTTFAKIISEKLGKKFVDIDSEIKKLFQMTIPEIFENSDDNEFRKKEYEFLKIYGKVNNLSLSTGGGAILNKKLLFSKAKRTHLLD